MKKIISLTLCVIFAIASTVGLSCCMAVGSEESDMINDNVFPSHEPYGKGIGAMPGRVVWSHEPDSVDWDGSGYWWQTDNFDEAVIKNMVNDSIASLGGKETAAEGWDSLFTAHNMSRNKDTGYTNGEKIAIKANINGSAVFDDDTSGETDMSYTNPVLLKALLQSLVEEAGVAPGDITVYDVSRLFPDYMVNMCNEGELNGVNFVGRDTGIPDENTPINWSYEFSGAVNYIPTCVTEAEYVINLANLKGHSYGITLCGKNHFGSFINGNEMRPPEGANLHQFLTRNEMDTYSPLTDLMANYELGGKTVLYMLDALICAVSEGSSITAENSKWQQAPFNNDYTSSIFVSQDPVAIDSVGADFLINEPTVTGNNGALRNNPNVENYLHEAGLVENAPSGTVYYDGNGNVVTNLGVHEHWNNSKDKLYSRNMGKDEGIELVKTGEKQNADSEPLGQGKTLIATFSRTGNTQKIADYIHDNIGGDMFTIKTVRQYSDDYDTILEQATQEKNSNARPELAAHVDNMDDYDTIFIGYPIWWGDTPMAIMTFLESYDFSGKKVIPFCTSGSSSPQTSFNRIKNTVPNAEVLSGFWTPGDNADNSAQAVKNWLDSLDLDISEQTKATTAEITTEKTDPTTAEITTVKTEPTTAKTAATTNKAETTDKQTETTTARAHTSGGGSGGGGGGSSSAAKTTTETSTEATTYTNTATEKSVEPTTNTKTSSNEVRVSIGSKTISISGRSYEIDAAPYIQNGSNSTLVPLRFAAVAISGGSVNNADESAVISWDASTKTASVHANGSVISFSAGSELMYKNNSPIVMENGVKAEIKDGRMFIPFRALGTALGVKVEWIAETKTAVYKTA